MPLQLPLPFLLRRSLEIYSAEVTVRERGRKGKGRKLRQYFKGRGSPFPSSLFLAKQVERRVLGGRWRRRTDLISPSPPSPLSFA